MVGEDIEDIHFHDPASFRTLVQSVRENDMEAVCYVHQTIPGGLIDCEADAEDILGLALQASPAMLREVASHEDVRRLARPSALANLASECIRARHIEAAQVALRLFGKALRRQRQRQRVEARRVPPSPSRYLAGRISDSERRARLLYADCLEAEEGCTDEREAYGYTMIRCVWRETGVAPDAPVLRTAVALGRADIIHQLLRISSLDREGGVALAREALLSRDAESLRVVMRAVRKLIRAEDVELLIGVAEAEREEHLEEFARVAAASTENTTTAMATTTTTTATTSTTAAVLASADAQSRTPRTTTASGRRDTDRARDFFHTSGAEPSYSSMTGIIVVDDEEGDDDDDDKDGGECVWYGVDDEGPPRVGLARGEADGTLGGNGVPDGDVQQGGYWILGADQRGNDAAMINILEVWRRTLAAEQRSPRPAAGGSTPPSVQRARVPSAPHAPPPPPPPAATHPTSLGGRDAGGRGRTRNNGWIGSSAGSTGRVGGGGGSGVGGGGRSVGAPELYPPLGIRDERLSSPGETTPPWGPGQGEAEWTFSNWSDDFDSPYLGEKGYPPSDGREK